MISVIVPVYNVEAYLERCIKSILSQTYNDFELILVDDGSNDESGKICDKYASHNVTVIHQNNLGVSCARNVGIENSKGDYLIFIDSDDWLDNNMFKQMSAFIGKSDLIVCSYYKAVETDQGKFDFFEFPSWKDLNNPFFANNPYYDVFVNGGTLWNKLIRRNVINDSRFEIGCVYGEDTLFLSKIIKNVKTAVVIPFPLYYYYVNRSGNVVSSKIDDRFLNYIDNMRKIYDEMISQNHPSIGVYKISTLALYEVLLKFDLTWSNIRKNSKYLRACTKLAKYPKKREVDLFEKERWVNPYLKKHFLYLRNVPFYYYLLIIYKRLKRT